MKTNGRLLLVSCLTFLLSINAEAANPEGFQSIPLSGQQTSAAGVVNCVTEFTFRAETTTGEPYTDTEIDVIFTEPGEDREIRVPAFWAGDERWKVRYAPRATGQHSFRVIVTKGQAKLALDYQGLLEASPYSGENSLLRHGPVRLSGNGRKLSHADGTPFLWLADSWWHGMTTRFRWPEDFQTLTHDRSEKGFSVIQFAVGFPCDIVEFDDRGANEAGFPISRDYRKINPAYFDRVDLRVQHLVDSGLVPNVLGTWGYYLPWFGVDNMKRYWRYVIARYGAYPVSWTVAGETTLPYYLLDEVQAKESLELQRKGWSEVARYIQETDPFDRILTAHPGPASGHFQPISDMSLLDMVMVQPGHGGWDSLPNAVRHLQIAQDKFPDQPVMQGEVCFEGMHGGGSDAKLQRVLFWTNLLSGAVGHCYGADAIWQFNTEETLFGPSPGGHTWGNTPWEEAYQWKGSFYVGLGRKILQRFDFHRFEPHPEWINPAANEDDIQHAYAAGISGEMRIFYFPRGVMPWGQKYTVRGLDEGAVYEAIYIDPLTGREYPLNAPVSGRSEWVIPPAPILQDWLLVLHKRNG